MQRLRHASVLAPVLVAQAADNKTFLRPTIASYAVKSLQARPVALGAILRPLFAAPWDRLHAPIHQHLDRPLPQENSCPNGRKESRRGIPCGRQPSHHARAQ